MQRLPFLRAALCAGVLAALAGCGNDPSADQTRADAEYARARSALARSAVAEADSSLRTALAIDRRLGRTALVAEEARQLGGLLAATARFDEALMFYKLSQDEFKALADRQGAREVTLDIAGMQRRMGRGKEAYAMYAEALRFARVFQDTPGALEIQWAMLPACRDLGDYAEEERAESELLKAYTTSGDIAQQARVYYEMGLSRFARAEYLPAAQHFVSAFTLAGQVPAGQSRDSLFAAATLLRLAMSYHAAGKERESFETYTDGLRRVDLLREGQPIRFEMLTRIGNIYLAQRQPGEAARFYRAALGSALHTGNRLGEGYLWIQLGHCETARGKDVEAYRSALELFKGSHVPRGAAYALRCLAQAAMRQNQAAEALQLYKSAVEQAEQCLARPPEDDLYLECERAYFAGSQGPCYDDLLELLLQLNRGQEAFWYAHRKNSYALLMTAGALDLHTRNEGLNIALSDYAHVRALRTGAERQLEHLLEAGNEQYLRQAQGAADGAARQLQDLGTAVAEAARALGPAVRLDAFDQAAVQGSLGPATALVQYVPTRRSLYALTLTRTRLTVALAAIERDQLAARAADFARMLRQEESAADSGTTRRRLSDRPGDPGGTLFEAFIRPIERDLPGIEELFVLFPAEIPLVPLQALRRARGSAYVAERYLVRYLPVASVLLTGTAAPSPVRDVVALGFPGFTGWDVEYELKDIRAFFKDARLYFAQQASLGTLQKEHADLLALAVEMRFSAQTPETACLVLSDGKSATGAQQIPAGEILQLPPIPTVAVSDLAAGRSGIHPAEPFLFLASGSSAVLMNGYLPSRGTKKYFGEQFYTALLSGVPTRAAFRKAQLEMIRAAAYTAPHAWGAFFLWGK